MRNYSRLNSVEEKKNLRQAIVYSVLALALLIFFVLFGLPAVAKFVGFLSDLGGSASPIESSDTTPPAPPIINMPPEATNKSKIQIEGEAEAGSTIKLFLNDKEDEILADKEGKFSFNFLLRDGENTFSAKAVDSAGNESQQSKIYKIIFDKKEPVLEITNPSDGSAFYGSGQRQVTIKGNSEDEVSVTINERIVVVEDDSSFSFTTSLSEGSNSFEIKAVDKAGNETTKTITLTFSP